MNEPRDKRLFERYYNRRLSHRLFFRVYRKIARRLPHYPQYYQGKKVKDGQDGSDYIKELLTTSGSSPFFVSRIGSVEGELVQAYMRIHYGLASTYPDWVREQASNNAGIFPTDDEHLHEFVRIFLRETKEVDCLAIWDVAAEHFILDTAKKPIVPIDFYSLYPGVNDWTTALVNKRVLVVHPFAQTIENQFCYKRDKLFKNPSLLPKFKLITLKSVVSLAGEQTVFPTWATALDWMFEQVKRMSNEFDVCLVGCGAYGLPLGGKIYRELRKQVIHIGGSLQLLFGIKGSVWEHSPITKHLVNDFWVYPSMEETPKNAVKVENSCYWAPQTIGHDH